MIEDDLRILMGSIAIPVYSRAIPLRADECISVQIAGGTPIMAGIRRASHTVTILSASRSKSNAMRNLAIARDFLITHIPADINGTHYYTATAVGDGSTQSRQANGLFIEFCDMEVIASL